MVTSQANYPIREKVAASVLKAGSRTFFFDVQIATNDKKYLKITESRAPKEGEEKGIRVSMVLFPEDAQNFQERLSEMLGHLG